MNYDFIVNEEQISELDKKLGEAREALDAQIEYIYTQIATLGDSWQGDSYTAFSNKCNEFRPTLEALSALLNGFQTMLKNQVSSGASETLVNDVKSALS